jgi:hypothetical protein
LFLGIFKKEVKNKDIQITVRKKYENSDGSEKISSALTEVILSQTNHL